MVSRADITIPVDGGARLHGWVHRPAGDPGRPRPAVSMAPGFGGVVWRGLEAYCHRLAEAGFVVQAHDNRGFGRSTGTPRGDIDPFVQIADRRRALSHLESLPGVDPDRIGVWGSSYAGGHAIVLGATERRVKVVGAQIPGHHRTVHRTPVRSGT